MLMKRRNIPVLAAIACLVVVMVFAVPAHAAGKGGKWIGLRYNYKPGQTLKYGVAVDVAGTVAMSGGGGPSQTMPISMTLNTNVNMDVREVDSEGTATVTMKLDEINMDIQSMGQSMQMNVGAAGAKMYSGGMLVFDSSQAGGQQSPMGAIPGLQGLSGGEDMPDFFVKGVTLKITRLGNVTAPELEAQAGIGGVPTAGALDQLFLPKRLVRPGDRWVPELSMEGMPAQEIRVPGVILESVFDGIEEFSGAQCAKIVTVLDVDPSGLPIEGLGGPEIDLSKSRVQGRGTAYFDVEQGQFLRQDVEISIAFAGSNLGMFMGPAMGAAGASSNMSVDLSMKINLEVVLKE